MKKYIVLFVVNIKKLKTLKYHTLYKKYYSFLLFAAGVAKKMKRCSRKKIQLKYKKVLG